MEQVGFVMCFHRCDLCYVLSSASFLLAKNAVRNENARSMSMLRQFGFDLLHTGHFYLKVSRRWFNSIDTHTYMYMRVYTHANWRSFLMVSEAFPFTTTANSLQPFPPSHHSSPIPLLYSLLSLKQEVLINRHVTADKSRGIHKGYCLILHKAND